MWLPLDQTHKADRLDISFAYDDVHRSYVGVLKMIVPNCDEISNL